MDHNTSQFKRHCKCIFLKAGALLRSHWSPMFTRSRSAGCLFNKPLLACIPLFLIYLTLISQWAGCNFFSQTMNNVLQSPLWSINYGLWLRGVVTSCLVDDPAIISWTMNPFQPSIHTHTHTNHFTFSLHPSISSSWLSFLMIRWHLLFRPVQNDRSISVSLRQLHTLSKPSYLSFEIQFVIWWTDIIILFRTTKKQSKSWQTSL